MNRMARQELMSRVRDARSHRVVFASHCLLNANVRYPGGACTPGASTPWLDRWQREGVGICQLPCPEEYAWGGILKTPVARAYGASNSRVWPFRRFLLAAFVIYTRLRYLVLARRVVRQVRDYRRSGLEVSAIVGVEGSPSCGVTSTLDVRRWLERAGRCPLAEIDRDQVNAAVIASVVPGRGWFIDTMMRGLERAGISVPVIAHDLVGELEGRYPAG